AAGKSGCRSGRARARRGSVPRPGTGSIRTWWSRDVSINVGSAFDLRKILPAGGVAGLSETFYDQTGPPPSPLLQNEVEFWTLGEAPGNPRLGSLGAFGLTPTGAVGRAAGLIGNAA